MENRSSNPISGLVSRNTASKLVGNVGRGVLSGLLSGSNAGPSSIANLANSASIQEKRNKLTKGFHGIIRNKTRKTLEKAHRGLTRKQLARYQPRRYGYSSARTLTRFQPSAYRYNSARPLTRFQPNRYGRTSGRTIIITNSSKPIAELGGITVKNIENFKRGNRSPQMRGGKKTRKIRK